MSGRPIKHERGLRQGDPISPMLFILTMDSLQRLLHLAVERGILNQILPRSKGIKASLYADDAAIFIRPSKQDVYALKEILDMFGEASGLHTNIQKSEVFPIGCDDLSLEEILNGFPAKASHFPHMVFGPTSTFKETPQN
jgi:hypothetical protein